MKLIFYVALILASKSVYAQAVTEDFDSADKTEIALGSYKITIPGGWIHKSETKSDQRVTTTIYHPNGSGTLQFMSLSASPNVITQEVLRNTTNVDSSINLNWQVWGDFNGYQYAYTENRTDYLNWWLANQEEILIFSYSSESLDESDKNMINGIVNSITAANRGH